MGPTVRSRLWAAGTSFLCGFVVANVGILLVQGADRWWWLGVAVVLMLTGGVGVLLADTTRRISIWAWLVLELFVVATLVPLWWVLVRVLTPGEEAPRTMWPDAADWSVFADAVGAGAVRDAAITSIVTASIATAVAMVLVVPAVYAVVGFRPRGSRAAVVLFMAVLLMPIVALAGSWSDTAARLDLGASRLATSALLLLVAIPVAVWLCTPVLRDAPWTLRDSIRADGANRRQEWRSFVVPLLLPDLLIAAALVWVVTAQDVVLGAALSPAGVNGGLPASMVLGSVEPRQAAAAALLWLLPVLVLVAIAPRRVRRLIGRDYR